MTTKLIKHDGYWIVVSDEKIKDNDWMIRNNESPVKAVPHFYWDFGVRYYKILYSQNPKHNLPTITFSDEVAKELGIVDVEKLNKDKETIWRDLFQLFTDNMIKEKNYTQEEWLEICNKNWNITEK